MADEIEQSRIVLDVWGGKQSMDHVARYLPKLEECWPLIESELRAGFLVNVRAEIKWGKLVPHDDRVAMSATSGVLQ